MYTQESDGTEAGTATPSDASPSDAIIADLFSQRCADDPVTVYHEVHAQCPVHRGPGMFGGHSVHVVDLRRRHVGAAAPRGVLVARTSSTSGTTSR